MDFENNFRSITKKKNRQKYKEEKRKKGLRSCN